MKFDKVYVLLAAVLIALAMAFIGLTVYSVTTPAEENIFLFHFPRLSLDPEPAMFIKDVPVKNAMPDASISFHNKLESFFVRTDVLIEKEKLIIFPSTFSLKLPDFRYFTEEFRNAFELFGFYTAVNNGAVEFNDVSHDVMIQILDLFNSINMQCNTDRCQEINVSIRTVKRQFSTVSLSFDFYTTKTKKSAPHSKSASLTNTEIQQIIKDLCQRKIIIGHTKIEAYKESVAKYLKKDLYDHLKLEKKSISIEEFGLIYTQTVYDLAESMSSFQWKNIRRKRRFKVVIDKENDKFVENTIYYVVSKPAKFFKSMAASVFPSLNEPSKLDKRTRKHPMPGK